MKDDTWLWRDTVAVSLIAAITFATGALLGIRYEARFNEQLIFDCEIDLPRSQHCAIIAIPEEEN